MPIEETLDNKVLDALLLFNRYQKYNDLRFLYKSHFPEIKKNVTLNGPENALDYIATLDESKRQPIMQNTDLLNEINRGIYINMVTDYELK